MLDIIFECLISVKSIIDNIIIITCCGLLFMVIGMCAWSIVLRYIQYYIPPYCDYIPIILVYLRSVNINILFCWVRISADRKSNHTVSHDYLFIFWRHSENICLSDVVGLTRLNRLDPRVQSRYVFFLFFLSYLYTLYPSTYGVTCK